MISHQKFHQFLETVVALIWIFFYEIHCTRNNFWLKSFTSFWSLVALVWILAREDKEK